MSEKIETLNERLIDYFGIDTITGHPMFRVVWSNDQTEKRRVNYTDTGILLLHSEVREVKKYSYIKDRWVLERLTLVPDMDLRELPTQKQSYEPIWTFETASGEQMYPFWEGMKFVIDSLHAALGKGSLAKYVEPKEETTEEGRQQRVDKLQAELFGNETEVGDALAHHEGIVVPPTYKKES